MEENERPKEKGKKYNYCDEFEINEEEKKI